jgi:hypothetical protein
MNKYDLFCSIILNCYLISLSVGSCRDGSFGSASRNPMKKAPSLDNIYTYNTNPTQRMPKYNKTTIQPTYGTNMSQRATYHNTNPHPGSPSNSSDTNVLSLRRQEKGKSLRDPFGSLLSLHEEEVAAAV